MDNVYRKFRPDFHGEYMWLEESIIPIYNGYKEVAVLIGFCRDIQERKEVDYI